MLHHAERRECIRFKNSHPDEIAAAEAAKALDDCRQAIRELQEYRARLSLGGLRIRDLIEEGRM
jgi:hypothetical protein